MLQNYEGMPVRPKRLRFSVDDYHKMIDWGLLRNVERAEIIDGELIESMPTGRAHAGCVKSLAELLRDVLGKSVTHSVQDPVWLDEYNQPIPDIAILNRRDDFYRRKAPTAEDVLVLIEVCDSSLDYDRNRKIPLYAEANIPEVWLVNLQTSSIEMHSQPRGYSYSIVKVFRRDEIITSEKIPVLSFTAGDIFEPLHSQD